MVTKAFEVQATSPKQDEKSGNTFFSGGPFFSGTTSWIAISTSAGVRARPVRAEPYHRYNKNDLPSCYSGRKYIIRQREKHFSDKKKITVRISNKKLKPTMHGTNYMQHCSNIYN